MTATAETRFVGSIPELYERHMGPVLFEPYARDLATRLPPTALRVLEIAAGTGRATRHLLAALPAHGELLATDLNPPMIDEGKRRSGNDPRLSWQVADAQALPVPDHSVNAVVCQFGLMFVPDKALAMREIKRVLAPGGIVLLSTWNSLANNPATEVMHELTHDAFADDPDATPNFMAVPFSMHDPAELLRLAHDAGFRSPRVDTEALTGEAESAAHLATGFVRGNPLVNHLIERGLDIPAFETHVAHRLAQKFGDRPCRIPLSAHILTAWA